MTNWEKIAFIEHELQIFLKMNNPGWKLTTWYNRCRADIENYKHRLINQESDEQDLREEQWY